MLRSRNEGWCGVRIHVTPDERTIHVFGCRSMWVLNADLTIRKQIKTEVRSASVDEFGYSPDGKLFAVLDYGRMQIFESFTGKLLGSIKTPPLLNGLIKFSSDGSYIAAQSFDETVGIYGIPRTTVP